MDKITESMVKRYAEDAGVASKSEADQFEYFAGALLLKSELGYDPESSIEDHIAGHGIQGYDFFAVVVNGEIVTDIVDLDVIAERVSKISVEFIFAQFKRSSSYKVVDFGNFVDCCRTIIERGSDLSFEDFPAAKLVGAVYDKADKFKENPRLSMFYVTTSGSKLEEPILRKMQQVKADIDRLSLTSEVLVECVGSAGIQRRWRELDQGIVRTILFEKKASMPDIGGVGQAYIGMLPAVELLRLVTVDGSSEKIIKSVFYDNVRDYQGHVDVNVKILNTLNSVDRGKFAVFNNGVTIVAQEISPTGDNFKLSNYQIVNGCQTVHVLHEVAVANGGIGGLPDVYVPVKIIATADADVARSIAQATNQQTQVSDESLMANSEQQKRIEEYFNSIDEGDDCKLFYERRLRQWSGNTSVVGAWRLVTIRQMIRAYGAMFLQIPHTANRYYNDLRGQAEERVFSGSIHPSFHWHAALLYCRVEFLFRNSKIGSELKPIKFHIMAAIARGYVAGRFLFKGGDDAVERSLSDLNKLIRDEDRLIEAVEVCAEVARAVKSSELDRDFCRTQESSAKYVASASRKLRMLIAASGEA